MSTKNAGAPPATSATPGTGAASTAATPAVTKPRTLAELQAGLKAGSVKGPFIADEAMEARVAKVEANPLDKGAFVRDGGKLVVYELPGERKFAHVRKSRGTGTPFVVRTSDVHQTFWAPGEKPKGSSKTSRTLAPATVDLNKIS